MTFEQIIDAAVELLERRKRLTYGALKRQFGLDDAGLEDLKQELIRGQRVARDEDGAVLVWQGSQATASPAAEEPRSQAERRQLTIMFIDLADSTALSNSLDIEELRVVLRAFQDAAGQVIARHDGFVNSYMGDGILVFFGYPRAYEDDAKRAVRAGLEVVAAVGALRGLPVAGLRVRVGIATGVVVVGDVIGRGSSREEAVVGNTSNLAARLQSLALPGEVVISGSTRKLLGRDFDCVEMGPQKLKGFDEPVSTWRVVGERTVEALWQAGEEAAAAPPMVDREVEFPALLKCWRLACAGQARFVTLRGEAGLGKSRLSQALREAVDGQDPLVLRYFCSARFQNTALYPVIRQLQHAAGFGVDDSPEARLDKLEAVLSRGLPQEELATHMPYYAALLSIPAGARYPSSGDSPERLRELTLRALQTQIVNLARDRPALLIFEDLHWVDPTTLNLIDQMARSVKRSRVMVLATSRPEFEPPWAELPHALTVELSLLERRHRSSIVEQHAGGKALPPEIVEHIVQKSDGIPLYVEELTKAMLESGLLREEADRYVLTGPMRSLAVPSTLHDSLLARLDRLSVVKEVAQAGAAIGREFAYRTLAAALPLSSDALETSLGRLAEAGLIHSRGVPPNAVYTFKHALIQDAAYATMLRPKRQGLHARIAQILEADPDAGRRAPELLAHHLTEANQIARAVPYLLEAGLHASASAAHTEACKHFEEGLRLVAELEDDDARHRLELRLRVHLGMSLAATLGFAAPQVEACNQRARELCRALGDTDELFWVLRGLCALYIVRSNAQASQELADLCVRLGQETQRDDYKVEAAVMEGYVHGVIGDLTRGREALNRAVRLYRGTNAGQLDHPTPNNPLVASLSLQAILSLVQGDLALASELIEDAVRTADERQRPFDQAYVRSWAAMFGNVARNPQQAAHHALIAIEMSQRHGYAGWLAACSLQLGVAKVALGAPEESIALIGGTLPLWQGSGSEVYCGYFMSGLAEAYRAVGRFDEARLMVDKAIAHADEHNEHWFDAVLYRQRGELLARQPDELARAEASFMRALEIARSQTARTFELRAALSMARCLGPAGRAAQARQTLLSALAQYTKPQDSVDHREAAALLEELGA